ncbi:MAG TPA: 6,7-dimethyl-8-ribityllumazine synthase [Blastocatellia bacterium]|nr:6,7-dimethyl-8-ribityllumazine synthase [Blastocatellia bacterium]
MPHTVEGKLRADGFKFAIVASRFNDFVVSRLLGGATDTLQRLGANPDHITIYRVPGSWELPLTVKKVAETSRFDAIICLGALIRGETPHFDYIAGEVSKGLSSIALETGIPITFGVLTVDTVEQAIDRAGLKSGNKGSEAAMSAIELVNLYKEI